MFKLIWRTIKDRKISLLAYSLGSFAFIEMFIALFPTFSKNQEELDKLIEIYPKDLFLAMGIDIADFSLSRLESFLSAEYFSLFWPIIVIILAVSFGRAQIAGEIEKGTIETLISQPISRFKLFFSKYIAGVINIVLFAFFSILSVIPLAEIHGVEYEMKNFVIMTVLGLLFGIAIFSISMLASSIFSEKGRVGFVVGGILMFSYAINVVSLFVDKIENIKYLSIFYYFDFSLALNGGQIDILAVGVFLGIIILSIAFGAFWFSRRDIIT